MTDNADVLYNKFNVDSSSPPDNPPQRPTSDYSCVVATTDKWRVSGCDEQHHVVCQSDHDTLSGIVTTYVRIFTYFSCVSSSFLEFTLMSCCHITVVDKPFSFEI